MNKKFLILMVFIFLLLFILVGFILFNVVNISSKPNEKTYDTKDTKVVGQSLDLNGYVDGDIDTPEEFKYVLLSSHYKDGASFVYVSENTSFITFNCVDNVTKEIFGVYVVNKETLEITVSTSKYSN